MMSENVTDAQILPHFLSIEPKEEKMLPCPNYDRGHRIVAKSSHTLSENIMY
jgi:hypothetical protein